MKLTGETPVRVEVIDAMRGFALFGLFSVHMQEHYNLFDFPASHFPIIGGLDYWTHQFINFVFAGKSYTIFAFLFGLSFYIQVDRQEQKGNNFLGRFLWRLILLFIFGLIHGLLYPGDILAFFALTGLFLLLFHHLSNKALIIIASVLLLQLPAYIEIALVMFKMASLDSLRAAMFLLFKKSIPIYSYGTLSEIINFNILSGRGANWLFMLLYGRVSQTLGLFILGILIGRTKVLEKISFYRPYFRKILVTSIVIVIPFLCLKPYIDQMSGIAAFSESLSIIVDSYINLLLSTVLFCSVILLFHIPTIGYKIRILKYAGRMSLSNYLLQSIICIPIFYGFGLGLYKTLGFFFSFCIGVVIFTAQVIMSKWWMLRYNYGPVEYFWRALTFFSFKTVKFKK